MQNNDQHPIKKTRQSYRQKKVSLNFKHVDQDQHDFVVQQRLNALESDFYDSPGRLADDDLSDDFEFAEAASIANKKDKGKHKFNKNMARRMKVVKKSVKELHVKKNLNLQKLLKEEQIDCYTKYPNFVNSHSKILSGDKGEHRHRLCSICCAFAKYRCPRCGQRYCSIKCNRLHKEIKCLKFDLDL